MNNSAFDTKTAISFGKKLFEQKRYLSAIEKFSSAAKYFDAEQNELMGAEMHNNLSVCHLMAGNAEKAFKEAKGTDVIFAKGGDIKRQAMALGNQAAAQEALKHPDKALSLYGKSEALLKLAGDRELRSIVLKHIASLQAKTGEKYQAVATMDAALNEEPKPSIKDKVLKKIFSKIFRYSKEK